MAVGCDNAGTPRKAEKGRTKPEKLWYHNAQALVLYTHNRRQHGVVKGFATALREMCEQRRHRLSSINPTLLSVVRQSSALGFVGRIFGRTHVVLRTTGWKWGIGWGPHR